MKSHLSLLALYLREPLPLSDLYPESIQVLLLDLIQTVSTFLLSEDLLDSSSGHTGPSLSLHLYDNRHHDQILQTLIHD